MLRKSIKEINGLLDHMLKVNNMLTEKGEHTLAIEVIGDAGLGKTSLIKQWADKNGFDFVKLSLSQFDDLGDFVGFPTRAYLMNKDSEKKWVKERAVDMFERLGWNLNPESRTEYCPPSWLSGKTKPIALLLDDWTRAQPRFQQAMMELIETQSYGENKLPKGSFVLLTSNPDNGDYMVNAVDSAMRTRFGSVEIEFNFEEWAEWADANGIDDRCINFFAQNREIYDQYAASGSEQKEKVNPRSITKFFIACGQIDDMSSVSGIKTLQDIGHMYVTEEITSLFVSFIRMKLDKLFTPYEVLTSNFDFIVKKMKSDFLGEEGEFRADIASMMSMRIKNYVKGLVLRDETHNDETNLTPEMISQLGRILKEDDVFPKDIRLDIAKTCYCSSPSRFSEWVKDSELRNYLIAR